MPEPHRFRRQIWMLGNEVLIEQITRQAREGSLSHAYLIAGEKGMGKKALAKRLCLEVFCKNKRDGKACGVCPDCKRVLSGNHPDLLKLTHEKPATISVDEVRLQVSDAVEIRPYEGGKKVIIIDEAEKMTVQAQNAILKTLEEPPDYVILLLLAGDDRALLDTIRSRCVKMKPALIGKEEIRDFLLNQVSAGGLSPGEAGTCSEAEPVDEDTAEMASSFARGNPGRALELATDPEFKKVYRQAVGLCRNIKSMDAADIAGVAKELAGSEHPEEVLELIENWYRDLLKYRATRSAEDLIFSAEQSAIRSLGAGIRPEAVSAVLEKCEEAAGRLRANVNKELAFMMLFLEMRDL